MAKINNRDIFTPEQRRAAKFRRSQIEALREAVKIGKKAGIPMGRAEKQLKDIDELLKKVTGI